nr:MAG TPA: hypothetical protein [Caudoviricetes sp.]
MLHCIPREAQLKDTAVTMRRIAYRFVSHFGRRYRETRGFSSGLLLYAR